MVELDLQRINLRKGDLIMGLGKDKALFVSSDGEVSEIGKKELPEFAYLMFPLVARIIPAEFEGPGGFTDIIALEEKLGEMFGSAEEVYEKVGPSLVRMGVEAGRLAKVFVDMSPLKTTRDTADVSQDVYNGYIIRLTNIIKKYYPGSAVLNRRLDKPGRQIVPNTGRLKGRDGISF